MNRRTFLKAGAGITTLTLPFNSLNASWISAQKPGPFASLGLPELTITLTDSGYTVSPASVPAGWTTITFVNNQSFGDNGADLMLIPEGETLESILESLAAAGPEGAPPDWVYQATFVGVPWSAAGTSAQGLGLLSPGEWAIFSPTPMSPATLSVTDGPEATPTSPTIEADVEIGMTEYSFSGLEESIGAGAQVWKVSTIGAQPHLMVINAVPEGTTTDQLLASWLSLFSGTPEAGALTPDQMPNVGGCGTLSRGESIYLALDLPAGTYGAVCFFGDPGTGIPHLMSGMVAVFTTA